MVFFFTSSGKALHPNLYTLFINFWHIDQNTTIYMGRDKYENEELIKYAYPHDIWYAFRD
jgi:predicted ribosome quality control (RQC) complex YloA/Tae2 family protein